MARFKNAAASAWDDAAKMVESATGGRFMKLADGESAVVVFVGDPHPREVAFVDGRYLDASDPDAAGAKATTRVAINVVHLHNMQVQVLEQGATFFRDLLAIRKKYGLDKWAFEITRQGTGLTTKYKILPDTQLSDEQRAKIDALPLIDLSLI